MGYSIKARIFYIISVEFLSSSSRGKGWEGNEKLAGDINWLMLVRMVDTQKRWKIYEWTDPRVKKKNKFEKSSCCTRGTKGVYSAYVYTRYVFNGLNANEKRCGLVVAKGRVDWKHRCDNRSLGG